MMSFVCQSLTQLYLARAVLVGCALVGFHCAATTQTNTTIINQYLTEAALPPAKVRLPKLGSESDQVLNARQEGVFGRILGREVHADPSTLQDPLVNAYLRRLIDKINTQQSTDIALQVFAVDDPQLNAFAMPGGLLGINRGLITAVRREGELVAVLGHEIGHISQRHFARGMSAQKNNQWLGIAGMIAGILAARSNSAQAGQVAQGAIMGSQALMLTRQLSFSRDMEREADVVGLDLMQQAGYSGMDMVHMLRRLAAGSQLNESTASSGYARTHPGINERMANTQAKLGSLVSTPQTDDSSNNLRLVQARLTALAAVKNSQQAEVMDRFTEQVRSDRASLRVAGMYGAAVLTLLSETGDISLKAESWLAGLSELERQHPWIQGLRLEIAARQGQLTEAQLINWINSAGQTAPETVLQLLVSASKNTQGATPFVLSASAQRQIIAFLMGTTQSQPNDSAVWQLLADAYMQAQQPADALMAQAEQVRCMGAWPSAEDLMRQALRLAGSSANAVSAATQAQWAARLQVFRAQQLEEKSIEQQFSK